MSLPVPAAALISALTADARALATPLGCPVVLHPADAESVWQEAVDALRMRLGQSPEGDVDCGGIEVHADGAQTSILFTTRDGRSAQRPVRAPGELLAVVEALETTLPEPSPSPQAGLPPSPAKNAEAERPAPAVASPAAIEGGKAQFLIDGSGGVRLGGAGNYTFGSFSMALGVGANVGRWELGVFGQYDPAQTPWPSLSGLQMSTWGLGVRAGRREPIGPVDGVAGASAAAAVTSETRTSNDASGTNQQGGPADNMEPRIGVYAGVVWPRHAPVRVRPELAFDVIANRIGNPKSVIDRTLPAPWWSTSASVAVEWEAP